MFLKEVPVSFNAVRPTTGKPEWEFHHGGAVFDG